MGDLVEFRRPEKPETWSEGRAVCIGCRNEWEQAAPTGQWRFDCPKCGANKGIFKHCHGASVGDRYFSCNCGCEALTAYMRDGKFWLRCMNCGNDQTEAVFG